MIRYQEITAEDTLLSEWDRFTSVWRALQQSVLEGQAESPGLKWVAFERALHDFLEQSPFCQDDIEYFGGLSKSKPVFFRICS